MEDKPTELDYHTNKKPHRTYVSKTFSRTDPVTLEKHGTRIVSKVMDCKDFYEMYRENNSIVLRLTPSERQEIIARVDEDTRGFALKIQRFNKRTGTPTQESFCFRKDELKKLLDFIESLSIIDYSNKSNFKIEDSELSAAKKLLSENPDLALEIVQQNITKSDVVALAYRKTQLNVFNNLLIDKSFFETKKSEWSKTKDEDVWQHFFEENKWIFGYGLNFVFNSSLEGKKLEQTIKGADIGSAGKRVDAMLKSRGIINSLCLVEIKTHETPLLKQVKAAYRSAAWSASDNLNGGIVQAQKTSQITLENIKNKLEISDNQNNPTGEIIYSYKPKSYIIIGNLNEFLTEQKLVNKEKFSSFELFRKNIQSPEIITFDELYERAKFIVYDNEQSTENIPENTTEEIPDITNIPF